MWFRVIREGIETHVFKQSEEKDEGGEVAVKSDARENPIHATTREDINDILADGYEVGDDRTTSTKNKPSATGKSGRPVYKEG